jgi:hypothetical protein
LLHTGAIETDEPVVSANPYQPRTVEAGMAGRITGHAFINIQVAECQLLRLGKNRKAKGEKEYYIIF